VNVILERPVAPARASSFAPLCAQINEFGLLERRRVRYAVSMVLNALLLAGVVTALFVLGDSWWQVAMAIPAAILTTRSAFFGHDAAHQQVARTRPMGRVLGLIHGNLLIGMSYGWWTAKHTRHHANPNHEEKDPDVGPGVLSWTRGQSAVRRGVLRWVAGHQALLFFPLLLAEGINLQVASIADLLKREGRDRAVEAVLLGVHMIGYFGILFAAMSPGKALLFIAIHQGLFGLHLGCSFAPNHKGMPMPKPGQRWDHLHRQVLTSRNVRGGAVTDWLLGGLNYQIEHHLFPSMPRPNLRRAQPLVRAHCARVGIPYTETSLIESYAIGLRHLHAVGADVRHRSRQTGLAQV
jgi:fatty acid desaturase